MTPAVTIALLQSLVAIAPQIPALVVGVSTAIGLISSGKASTPAEMALIDAALDAANAHLQAS